MFNSKSLLIGLLLLFFGGCNGCDEETGWDWLTGPGGDNVHVDMNIHAYRYPGEPNYSPELLRLCKILKCTGVRTTFYADLPGGIETVNEMARLAPQYNISTFLVVVGTHSSRLDVRNWDTVVRRALNINASHYQVLNEIDNFYKGISAEDYVKVYLSRSSWIIRSSGKKVVSAAPTGDSAGFSLFKKLLNLGMAEYVDVIAIHSYAAGPNRFVEEVRKRGIKKPIWITEVGNPNPDQHIRTYESLSGRTGGVEKVFWYVMNDESGFSLLKKENGGFVKQSPLFDYLADRNPPG